MRRALVTGASSGIGEAFARRLAREGWALRLVARRRNRLEALAAELRARHRTPADVLAVDLTDAAGLRVVERALGRDPRLELLVNDAGMGDFGRFVARDRDREEAEIRLNVLAVVRLTHAALPGMIARGRGAVINVSSLAAFQPTAYMASYGATKAFLNSFTGALHEELRGTGVAVQALCPGFTHTEIFAHAGADPSALPSFLWMEPEEVVATSLAALARGDVICVPGLGNRALSTLSQLLPAEVRRWLAALVTGRVQEAPPAPARKPGDRPGAHRVLNVQETPPAAPGRKGATLAARGRRRAAGREPPLRESPVRTGARSRSPRGR
jgi:short-subunit dehydrogenase